tara:strand:- start:1085 stop:1615 length:531 start_codon:yes stop_codon:yes gene_type:complete
MKLIILDRDGVINFNSKNYIKSPDEWLPIPGSLEAISNLNKKGYKISIATNQSGISRGLFDLKMLEEIHNKLYFYASNIGAKIDSIFFCPHTPEMKCSCRKPKTGMLKSISKKFSKSLNGVPMVGDSLSDLLAAKEMRCEPFLVKTGNGMNTLKNNKIPKNTNIFENLSDVAKYLT